MTDTDTPRYSQLWGMDVAMPPPSDSQPIEFVGCVKMMDADGDIFFWMIESRDVTAVEAYGMLRIAEHEIDERLVPVYFGTDDDDD